MTLLKQNNTFRIYFLATYLIVLYLIAEAIPFKEIGQSGWLPFSFTVITFLLYGLFYLLPSMVITSATQWLITRKQTHHLSRTTSVIAIITAGVTTLFLYANAKIFSLYGMFFNGFILNLIMTPGGIESLGGSTASSVGYGIIAATFIMLQVLILWISKRIQTFSLLSKISFRFLPITTIVIAALTHIGFALDGYTTNQFNQTAESIPFYQTVSARGFFKTLGLTTYRDTKLKVKGKLNYPLKPIQIQKPAKPYNIIWLTSESLRADMLEEHIMPNSWNFAKNASRFTRNYSTGNGTRMGVFGMFTGLPGNYWFPFLEQRKGAAIIDVLQQQEYQMSFYTSAKFSYPEFEKTIFSNVPSALLHDDNKSNTGWENDRDNVNRLLAFIDQRDTNKPFFTFMFFESPHARYYFPPESVIAMPYRDDINYATINKKTFKDDIRPIKNRYINSVHHLDMQWGRIFEYLKQHQLLDNTIVILIGDHGEEFMEHEFWGHNSTFVDEQIRTPLVIYVPKMPATVSDQITSHMDIVPTIMPLLGVSNISEDYATGYNLLAGERRNYTYVSDWDKVTYIDHEIKITQPVNGKSFTLMKASKADDIPLTPDERKILLERKQSAMSQLKNDLNRFFKAKTNSSKQ